MASDGLGVVYVPVNEPDDTEPPTEELLWELVEQQKKIIEGQKKRAARAESALAVAKNEIAFLTGAMSGLVKWIADQEELLNDPDKVYFCENCATDDEWEQSDPNLHVISPSDLVHLIGRPPMTVCGRNTTRDGWHGLAASS